MGFFSKMFGKKASEAKNEMTKIENRDLMQAIVGGAVVIGITAFEILLGKAKWSNARQCVTRNGSAR